MIKKFITLFKLGRKVAKSDILELASKFQEPPLIIKILFKILAISFTKKELNLRLNCLGIKVVLYPSDAYVFTYFE